jgi:hypothetical protein
MNIWTFFTHNDQYYHLQQFDIPPDHVVFVWIEQKNYSTNNFSASPVFLIHVSVAISYHSSHNVMFTLLMNIMYLLNYI